MRRAGLTWPMRRSETDTADSTHRAADADLDAIVESGRGDADRPAVSLLAVRHRPHRLRGDLARQPAAVVTAWQTAPLALRYRKTQLPRQRVSSIHSRGAGEKIL
jgi:hypothetical protein